MSHLKGDETDVRLISIWGRNYLFDTNTGCIFSLSRQASEYLNGGTNCLECEDAITEMARLKSLGLIGGPTWAPKDYQLDSLSSICLFLTSNCNLRCKYCYERMDSDKNIENVSMSRDTASAAIDFLLSNSRELNRVKILFFGGEPLLNMPLLEFILEYASKIAYENEKTITYSITTNGTIYNEKISSIINKYNIRVLLSFDGPPAIQDKMRPFVDETGSHEVVLRNIQRYRSDGIPIQIRSTVTRNEDLLDIFDYLTSNNLSNFIISPASGALRPDARDLESPISHLILSCLDGKLSPDSLMTFANIRKIAARLRQGKRRYMGCGAAAKQVAIDPLGNIYPCHRFVGLKSFEMGTVFDGIDETKRANFVTRCLVTSKDTCSKCWGRFFCGGGCAYMNMIDTGSIDTPLRSNCRMNLSVLKKLIPLLEEGII